MAEFIPEFIFDAGHWLGQRVKIYLDGVLQKACFEARIKWASFETPTTGVLVIAADEGMSPAAVRPPREGEYVMNGVWVKQIKGEVLIVIDEESRAEAKQVIGAFRSSANV